jgi:peptidoglycan/LPS O-acetylase OafA/YrhL
MVASGELSPKLNQAQYVPALDGLRALSVIAVIAYHAELAPLRGGFLGVEVFFVVSGYLISALLLIEQSRTGRISLPQFWQRRARRLLPALFALLAAALLAARFIAPDAMEQTRSDAAAALLYVSNWWQVIHHHSYFMAVQRPPLLLHLWSLAVEEQFYLCWPLAVALLGHAARRYLIPASLSIALGSALWMAWLFDPTADATRVYVGTDCRLSGLLLGATLAAVTRRPLAPAAEPKSRATRAMHEAFAVLGLAGLSWTFVQLTDHDAWLYHGGLVLVDLATCALIVGLVQPTFLAACFAARPLTWLGRRSYGLYLWHWPIFALSRPEQDLTLNGPRLLVLRLALTLVATELCYRYVETPVRRGALSALFARLRARPRLLLAWAGFLLVAAIGLVCVTGQRAVAAHLESSLPTPLTLEQRAPRDNTSSTGEIPVAGPDVSSVVGRGIPLDPTWPKTLTLLTDSVTLAVSKSLPLNLPGWKVEVLGRPALMVKQVVPEFLNARSVGSVVVVGLAYNSLFEKDRRNYERWAEVWDRSAERLLTDLKACGAKKLVWVTLREPSAELVTEAGRDQYREYAWFFPYVNERIRALALRHPELALADWQAVSNVPDITKDLIHLNPAGVTLMTSTITQAVLGPAQAH